MSSSISEAEASSSSVYLQNTPEDIFNDIDGAFMFHLWPLVSSPDGSKHIVTSTFAAKKSCSVRASACVAVLCMFQFLTIPHTSAFTFLGKKLDIYFLDTLLLFFLFMFFSLALL